MREQSAGVTTFGSGANTSASTVTQAPKESVAPTVHNKDSIVQSMVIESQGTLTYEQASIAYKAIFNVIIDKLAAGDEVLVTGFGKLFGKVRNPRIATHPATGEKINVPAKRVPGFKPGKNTRKAVALPDQKV